MDNNYQVPTSSPNPTSGQSPYSTPSPLNPVTPTSPQNNDASHRKVGPVIVTLVVVLIVVIGALYLLASKINKESVPSENSTYSQVESASDVPTVTNPSDEVMDIQQDLEVSTSGLDEQNF
ncbi:MAG: hypothetical protein WC648_02085 [Candidatus Paceibacterota bacterium]|jgi:hypothetical protein